MTLRRLAIACAVAACVAGRALAAQTAEPSRYIARSDQQPVEVPAEARGFVPAEYHAVALETADLDGDGRGGDYLLVAELSDSAAAGLEEGDRALLVLTRRADGSLALAARSDRAALCRACGGMMGDPLQGVSARHGGFTVHHYGGSGWRWSQNYTFSWSPEERTWVLKKVGEVSYHASFPDKIKIRVRRAGRDFVRVRLADFDPDALAEG